MPTETTRTPEPTTPTVTPARFDRAESAAQSFVKVEGEILALPEGQIGRVTADVAQSSAIALGALPNLMRLKPEFSAFADSDYFIKKVDMLQDYAMAAFYAHVRTLPGSTEKEVLQLLERGKPIRENLLKVAEAFVGFGIFDATLVQSIRAGQGNLDTAKDLVALATLFNANWEKVQGKVPFDLTMVEEAGSVGANLLHAIGITEIGDVRNDKTHDWLSLRARAFRLLVNEYEEIRRAVAFLRWHHGDAIAFTPSLHSGIKKTLSGKATSGTQSLEQELPSAEEPTLANSAEDVPPGMPGGSPFES